MKHPTRNLIAASLVLVPLVSHGEVGASLVDNCLVAQVQQQVRTADSLIPEVSFQYLVALASLQCQQPMVLTGGVTIQNFDQDFVASETGNLTQLQNQGNYQPAVFIDGAYSVSVRPFAGISTADPNAPRTFLNSHALSVATSEPAYTELQNVMNVQGVARIPSVVKSGKAPFKSKTSWTRTLKFISIDRTFGIVIGDLGPSLGYHGRWDEPEISVTVGYRMSASEVGSAKQSHLLNSNDSQALRNVVGSYLKIHDVTTGSDINDRDVTMDCRGASCVVSIETFYASF